MLGLKSLSLKSDFLTDISSHASSSLENLKFLRIVVKHELYQRPVQDLYAFGVRVLSMVPSFTEQ
ncbi:hypothetical protein Syun_019494 [Stephania yunnanensis]|uniref:Uncharacterized protein n=1 Tax=Stephania yunnanensis TaxID=152371 RepID=A0AAP0IW84_9MAGN